MMILKHMIFDENSKLFTSLHGIISVQNSVREGCEHASACPISISKTFSIVSLICGCVLFIAFVLSYDFFRPFHSSLTLIPGTEREMNTPTQRSGLSLNS